MARASRDGRVRMGRDSTAPHAATMVWHMRCANGYRESTRSMRRWMYRKQLDLETLVCTRGLNFPLSRLESRPMCAACGNRGVTMVFEPRAMSR
jgi:hypothetical protein